MTRTEALIEQKNIDQRRSILFRAESKGFVVPDAEWEELGEWQSAVNRVLCPTDKAGYYV
jgi:hypothetical protein